MAKILALGAYLYQAVVAFGLLIVVARLLPARDYAAYSLFMATSQFVAIAFFEWIRFACTRFYPGPSARTEATQRRTMLVEFSMCTLVCIGVGGVSLFFGLPVEFAIIGAGVAILQGASDLQLTIVQFYGRFHDFSWMQGLRATLLALATCLGAFATRTVFGAIIGLLCAYLLYAAAIAFMERKRRFPRQHWGPAIARQHLQYGTVAAGASILGLMAPLGLRYVLIASFGPQVVAGALLAVDLLQRPFVLIISALHAVTYPEVVAAFDRGQQTGFARTLGQYYGLVLTLTLIAVAGILVLLPPVALVVLKPGLQSAFLQAAPLLIGIFFVRSLTQNLSTTPAHLRLNLKQLILLALADVVGLNLFALVASHLPDVSIFTTIAGAGVGTVLAALPGIAILMSLPFDLPQRPVLIASAAALIAAVLALVPIGGPLQTAALGVGIAGIVSLGALYTLFFAMKPGQA